MQDAVPAVTDKGTAVAGQRPSTDSPAQPISCEEQVVAQGPALQAAQLSQQDTPPVLLAAAVAGPTTAASRPPGLGNEHVDTTAVAASAMQAEDHAQESHQQAEAQPTSR